VIISLGIVKRLMAVGLVLLKRKEGEREEERTEVAL